MRIRLTYNGWSWQVGRVNMSPVFRQYFIWWCSVICLFSHKLLLWVAFRGSHRSHRHSWVSWQRTQYWHWHGTIQTAYMQKQLTFTVSLMAPERDLGEACLEGKMQLHRETTRDDHSQAALMGKTCLLPKRLHPLPLYLLLAYWAEYCSITNAWY